MENEILENGEAVITDTDFVHASQLSRWYEQETGETLHITAIQKGGHELLFPEEQ